MCGIVGWAEPGGRSPAGGAEAAERALGRALERMAHRGPDGRAVWLGPGVALGHARLAVRDPGAAGAAQPIATPDGRFVLVYNGELYDDERWRRELADEVARRTGGAGFRTRCDAETLLWALVLRGASALDRVRGMYALAFVDVERRTLLLARDPLGVKPLFHATTPTGGIAFASEVAGLRALGCVDADRLDPEAIPGYLATSRRTLFGRTLFAGVRAVGAGEVLRVDLGGRSGALRPGVIAAAGRFEEAVDAGPDADALAARTRAVVQDSVARHLAADVPLCGLLSGGLDSAAVTWSALQERPGALATFCAAGVEDGAPLGEDPVAAEECARALGTRHTFVGVRRDDFAREWRAHVEHLEQPLSTPNEVAIAMISRRIADSGAVVALSGEGADELFGGYGDALAHFLEHGGGPDDAADFHLCVTSWFPREAQAELLADGLADALEGTRDAFRAGFRRAAAAAGPAADGLEPHLRMQRDVNLTALLERLDAATMRASVEGRTPFADVEVARHAARLPARHKFVAGERGDHRTKIALRAAFEGVLPPVATARPKASFPLPFERWCEDVARPALRSSELVADLLRPGALEAIEAGALGAQTWRAWWLLGNLALTEEALTGTSDRAAPVVRRGTAPAA